MALLQGFTSAYAGQRSTHPKRHRPSLLAAAGRTAARTLPTWQTIRALAMDVTGLGLLSTAAGTLHLAAGLAAAGVSCLLLSWRGVK
jgi:hypothetical protein